MQLIIPKHTNRSPEQIISENIYFDSVGYIYRALSWLDIAKNRLNVCALQYAAHDTRQGIEQLLFEELIMSVGGELERVEYEKSKGNATKIHSLIRSLSPDYERLAQFTHAVMPIVPDSPPIAIWNHKELMQHWGRVSNYLHWSGEPSETVESKEWVSAAINTVEAAANHIWEKKTHAYTAIMMPDKMVPKIRKLWDRFKAGHINLEQVKRKANRLLPTLRKSYEKRKSKPIL